MDAFSALGVATAFGGGLLSFAAPCVLPLVPGYIAYLAGVNSADPVIEKGVRLRTTAHAALFVLGFATLYVVGGGALAQFGGQIRGYQPLLEKAGGVLLIVFGLGLIGLLRIPFITWDYRIPMRLPRATWGRSWLTGMAFGAGWSACTGPILASILVLTATSHAFLRGATLMFAFSLGLGVPFVLAALLADRGRNAFRRAARYTQVATRIGGASLVLLGLFLVTGLFRGYA
jgi:cytochrome c-type biogenesis protein